MVWDIAVSVRRKRVCSKSVGVFPLQPNQLWELLALKESRPVFRVEDRKQLSCTDGRIVERVVFVAPVRIVFWKKWAHTEVHQTVDMSDPSNVTVTFDLVQSDMMSHLSGSWHFEQIEAPHKGSLGKTKVTYCFEMWPKGVPTALRFMPGLLDAVKSAVGREAGQLLDKLAYVAYKVQPGMCLLEAARQASAEVDAAGGSFKCLTLQQSGNASEAAAAAAAEAAGRQQLKMQASKQQQEQVVCHALEDVSSDDDDCLVAVDSASTISSTCSLAFDSSSCDLSANGSVRSCSSSIGGGASSTTPAGSPAAAAAAMAGVQC